MTVLKKELDEIDKKILRGLADGKTKDQIAFKHNLNIHGIVNRLRAMKKYYSCTDVDTLLDATKQFHE